MPTLTTGNPTPLYLPVRGRIRWLWEPIDPQANIGSDIAIRLWGILDIKTRDLAVLYTKDVYHSLVLQPVRLPF